MNRLLASSMITGLIVGVLSIVVLSSCGEISTEKALKLWQAKVDEKGRNVRYDIRHQVAAAITVGMSRAKVVDMLGAPDGKEGTSVVEYDMGCRSGFGVDEDVLRIVFDADSVAKVAIVQR